MSKLKINKLKTKKGAAKRFIVTAGGIKFNHSNHNHILTKKNSKRKSRLCELATVCASDERNIARLLLVNRPAKINKKTKDSE